MGFTLVDVGGHGGETLVRRRQSARVIHTEHTWGRGRKAHRAGGPSAGGLRKDRARTERTNRSVVTVSEQAKGLGRVPQTGSLNLQGGWGCVWRKEVAGAGACLWTARQH